MSATLRPSARSLWAYAYMIVPPQPEAQLGRVRTIVDHEHSAALGGARVWAGRLVLESLLTYILIVSDSPEKDLGINHQLEAELANLNAEFVVTEPMAIRDYPEGAAPHTNGASKHLPLTS